MFYTNLREKTLFTAEAVIQLHQRIPAETDLSGNTPTGIRRRTLRFQNYSISCNRHHVPWNKLTAVFKRRYGTVRTASCGRRKSKKKILYNTYKCNYIYTYKRFVMEAKLTLKMDKKIINSMKQYAAKNDKSISKMVEDYFRNLTVAHKEPENISPLVKELSGIIDEKDLEKVSYTDYLEKKYE